jgi:hypothetical protein
MLMKRLSPARPDAEEYLGIEGEHVKMAISLFAYAGRDVLKLQKAAARLRSAMGLRRASPVCNPSRYFSFHSAAAN